MIQLRKIEIKFFLKSQIFRFRDRRRLQSPPSPHLLLTQPIPLLKSPLNQPILANQPQLYVTLSLILLLTCTILAIFVDFSL